ncbi:helix-turn-helix domain-containing protein [Paenibacillus sp. JSM ZJ436]|uniref:helix-turn-helix domain-containing protein n=1 Tax=Paenibacillus sp. JSM ZJ436 TaxID=3376190 RepID=UPI003797B132
MIGLDYILSTYNMTRAELAKRMGINRANISMYIRSSQIPEKRLEQIVDIFPNVSKEYFTKELGENDKFNINISKHTEGNIYDLTMNSKKKELVESFLRIVVKQEVPLELLDTMLQHFENNYKTKGEMNNETY